MPRKSKRWAAATRLENVEGARLHRTIGPEWVVLGPQRAGDGIDRPPAATDAAHDAVPAVAGVHGQSRDRSRSQQRPPIRGVGVLAGLEPPLQPRRPPDLLPEGNDARQRVVTPRIEQPEGKRR